MAVDHVEVGVQLTQQHLQPHQHVKGQAQQTCLLTTLQHRNEDMWLIHNIINKRDKKADFQPSLQNDIYNRKGPKCVEYK